jgi:hypothetical protein
MNNFAYTDGELKENPHKHLCRINWNIAVILKTSSADSVLSLIARYFKVPDHIIDNVDELADFMVINNYSDWSITRLSNHAWVLKYGERND